MSKEYPYTEEGLTYINKDFIVNEFTTIKWHATNKAHYVALGYTYTRLHDEVEVKSIDLMTGSTIGVMALCSGCNKYRKSRYSGMCRGNNSLCRKCASSRYNNLDHDGEFNHEYILGKCFDNFKVVGYIGKTDKGSELFVCDYSTSYNENRNSTWVNDVKKRDGECQVCGDKDDLVAHHLNNFANHIEERDELSNGITLCKSCHLGFHSYMGGTIKPCTIKDFYRWYFIVKYPHMKNDTTPLLLLLDTPISTHTPIKDKKYYTSNELLDMKSVFDPISIFGLDIFLAIENGNDTIRKISDMIGQTLSVVRRNTHLLHTHGFLHKGSRTNDNSWHWFVNTDIDWDNKFKLFDVLPSSHISNEQLLYELTYNVKHILRKIVLTLDEPMTLKDLSEKTKRHKTTTRVSLYKLRDLGIVEKKTYNLWGITDEYSNKKGIPKDSVQIWLIEQFGWSAQKVFESLDRELTVKELGDIIDKHPQTVRENLKSLQKIGLVKKVSTLSWSRVEDIDWDVITEEYKQGEEGKK